MPSLNYYRRVLSVYFTKQKSQLSFWHNLPEINDNFDPHKIGEYYMPFFEKAHYSGPFDDYGIPLLDYHGKIGKQYNPIAISQYALGNYNLFKRKKDARYKNAFYLCSDWLVEKLEENKHGLMVWNHYFDFEYKITLKSPWYSALAQGQGISVLVRAYLESGNPKYKIAAEKAYKAFNLDIFHGGVRFIDRKGDIWFEEYIVDPPTHILNGFIWALWGIYDYHLCFNDKESVAFFNQAIKTIANNLPHYDCGFWSLYDLSNNKLKNVASPFYHKLHIVQMRVLYRLTGNKIFNCYADKWESYQRNPFYRRVALLNKGLFKACYY